MSAGSRHDGRGSAARERDRGHAASLPAPRPSRAGGHVAKGHVLVPTTTCRQGTWPEPGTRAPTGSCYRSPHGRPRRSASEIRFVRLLVGSKVVGLEPFHRTQESHVPEHVRRARRERGVGRRARGARHRQSLPDPVARDPARARRHRPAREVPDRLGQDARVRDPARRARRRATTRGPPRSSSSRRASSRSRSPRRSRHSPTPATSRSPRVYGGVALRPQANRARDAHVIVATPGRLQDLLDRRLVTLDAVEILVLDEADRMLDMGFKPQVDRIVKRLPRDRQTMFFSATLDGEVGELARSYTQSPGTDRGGAADRARARRDRAPVRLGHAGHQGREARRAARGRARASRSSSSARSAAPTGWPASSRSTA